MRLNFAGSTEADIREGVRRIGEIMGGDTGLFGALTKSRTRGAANTNTEHPKGLAGSTRAGAGQAAAQEPNNAAGDAQGGLADVVELPTARKTTGRRRNSR
jgi:hypothetical protein